MNLTVQFKVIFFSFIYGMFFYWTLYFASRIKYKVIIKNILFFFLHTIVFYYLLYKVNAAILNIYIPVFFIFGALFCKVLYFNDKNT